MANNGVNTAKKEEKRNIAQNKKAYHEYFIEETIECGIELFGTEVKSLREGRVNLKDSYCNIVKGEVFVNGMHISPYEKGNIFNKDPLRVRKLLLHRREINKLIGLSQQQGYTLIPTSLYFLGSKVKLEMALAKGKKNYDKRNALAEKEAKRRIDRKIKEYNQ